MIRLQLTFIFLISFCLFQFQLAAQNVSDITGDRFEEIAGRGLVLRSNPAGVKVFIDNVERAVTPVTFGTMPHGEYHIRLSKEGYKDRSFYVTLFNTSRLVVSINMEEERGLAFISVHREPNSPEWLTFNPQIFTGAPESFSATPVFHDNNVSLSLPIGYHTIRVRAFGWEETSVTVLINEGSANTINIFMKAAPLRLENASQSRRRLNPLNSGNLGVTEFRYEVSAPGTGTITIMNSGNETVYKNNIGIFDSRIQRSSWNGRDSEGKLLPQGIYTVLIEAISEHDSREVSALRLETEINYSGNIIPLSLESGISGLTFAPMPHVLPARSYQFAGGISLGSFLLQQEENPELVFSSFGFPFEISMRAAIVNRLELATFVSINPFLNNQTQTLFAGWGISGSLKFNIFNGSGTVPLAFATGISYAWASLNGDFPLSSGRGIGLHLPLSLELTRVSIVFCPAVLWRGPEGFIPALLLSTGALYQGSWLNTGLSMRCELDFTENTFNPKFLAGAEVHLFPPPSNFVFSFLGGFTYHKQQFGGYGGFKIGIIN